MVVNHNGFVVKHPLLKTQELWNKEPPSIDVLETELASTESAREEIKKVSDQSLYDNIHRERCLCSTAASWVEIHVSAMYFTMIMIMVVRQ